MHKILKPSKTTNTSQKRQFLGKTDNFTSKSERSFHQRMLKAYLKGYDFFAFGTHYVQTPLGMQRQPKMYPVLKQG